MDGACIQCLYVNKSTTEQPCNKCVLESDPKKRKWEPLSESRRPQKQRKVAKRATNSRYATALDVYREFVSAHGGSFDDGRGFGSWCEHRA